MKIIIEYDTIEEHEKASKFVLDNLLNKYSWHIKPSKKFNREYTEQTLSIHQETFMSEINNIYWINKEIPYVTDIINYIEISDDYYNYNCVKEQLVAEWWLKE